MLPTDFPPWEIVYQQAQRWIAAGCFEGLVHDLRALLRMTDDCAPAPTAVIGEAARDAAATHGIEVQVVRLPEAKRAMLAGLHFTLCAALAWTLAATS